MSHEAPSESLNVFSEGGSQHIGGWSLVVLMNSVLCLVQSRKYYIVRPNPTPLWPAADPCSIGTSN